MVSLLSSDCYFESLALQETFAGPQVCPPPVLPQITVCTLTRSIPLLCFAPQLHKPTVEIPYHMFLFPHSLSGAGNLSSPGHATYKSVSRRAACGRMCD